jgi:hypothetical protein
MKKIPAFLLLFSILQCAEHVSAQQPEKIYGKNKVLKTNEYYLQQMELWKKEVDKDPGNAAAWYNYYRADRNAYIVGEEKDSLSSRSINRFARLNTVVLEMEKQVPASYEYNMVKWMNGNNDLRLISNLQKAHELAPKEMEPVMALIYYNEITGNYAERDKNIETCYQSGEFSPGLLNYGYNQLAGLEKDAIILAEGDKDTDATFLLQEGKGIRTDVRLVNLGLLLNKEYRERIFKELEIPGLAIDPYANNESYDLYRQSVIEQFTKNKKNRPVYVTLNVSIPYTLKISEKLYLTGLAYKYSAVKIDNLPLLEKNFEERYALDYLKVYFVHDISEGNVHQFNGNYLLPLAALVNYYQRSGNRQKADHYRELAQTVAKDAGRADEPGQLLNKKDVVK